MKSKVKIKKTPDDAIKKLNKIAKSFEGQPSIKVGLPKGSNDYPDGTSTIMVGAVHEFGSDARNIPQRSFLRMTLNNNKKKYAAKMKKIAQQEISGKSKLEKSMQLMGVLVQGDVVSRMTTGISPKLKGRDGTPLIDTGHLRQSITYVVNT